jgi:hypothetical protein
LTEYNYFGAKKVIFLLGTSEKKRVKLFRK